MAPAAYISLAEPVQAAGAGKAQVRRALKSQQPLMLMINRTWFGMRMLSIICCLLIPTSGQWLRMSMHAAQAGPRLTVPCRDGLEWHMPAMQQPGG